METPSFTEVYFQSWSAARRVLAGRSRFYWMWIAGAAIVGALSLLIPDSIVQSNTAQIQPPGAAIGVLGGWGVMAGILVYFVLADAVRAFVPKFAMTAQTFILTVVLNMVTSMAIQFAAYCFLIPAFYVAPKMWLWVPNYLLESTENTDIVGALGRAWRDTNNLYWPTFGLMAFLFIGATVAVTFALGIAMLLVFTFHPLAILATPLLLALVMYLSAQAYWAWLQWAVVVRRHADALVSMATVVVPA